MKLVENLFEEPCQIFPAIHPDRICEAILQKIFSDFLFEKSLRNQFREIIWKFCRTALELASLPRFCSRTRAADTRLKSAPEAKDAAS